MPVVQTAQPLPGAFGGIAAVSYGTATIRPIAVSLSRSRLYGSTGSSGVLSESIDDAATWTTVYTFTENVTAIMELDDGEALVITSDATKSYVYRSTGFAASHTAATWTRTLTSVGGQFGSYASAAHSWSMGDDTIRPNTSRVGVVCEYGLQTASATDTQPRATRAWLTTDYGATWTLILDLTVRYPGKFPIHLHGIAYDPWWDRIWVLYGDTQPEGSGKAEVLYSDDRGATWQALATPREATTWGFQCTTIAVLRDCILLGSDGVPGIWRVPRIGYRKPGDIQLAAMIAAGTPGGASMISSAMSKNRRQLSAPVFATHWNDNAAMVPAIYGSVDGGASMSRLWSDPAVAGSGTGIGRVVGPTSAGAVFASVLQSSSVTWLLKGELVAGIPNANVGTGTVTGDGTATVFSFPHGLPAAPSRFRAWQEKPCGAYTVSATATNIVVTFTTAPGASIPFQWRAGV